MCIYIIDIYYFVFEVIGGAQFIAYWTKYAQAHLLSIHAFKYTYIISILYTVDSRNCGNLSEFSQNLAC